MQITVGLRMEPGGIREYLKPSWNEKSSGATNSTCQEKKIRSELNKVLQADWQTQQQKLRSEMETRIKRGVTRMGMET